MTDRTFRWWLGMLRDEHMSSDEFVVGQFRIRLMGNTLELSFEGLGTSAHAAAQALAERYVAVLQRHKMTPLWLMTEEEAMARTTPPFGGMLPVISAIRE